MPTNANEPMNDVVGIKALDNLVRLGKLWSINSLLQAGGSREQITLVKRFGNLAFVISN